VSELVENNLLLIGGSSRNVGKTAFVVKLIEKFASNYPIVGLKIKTVYEGDDFFHGKDRTPLDSDFRLIEEFDGGSDEDTSKMLRAGAKRAFRLKVKSDAILKAFNSFKDLLNEPCLIVCESNSLRKVSKPSVYLLIKQKSGGNMKPSSKELEKFADKIIYTNGVNHDFDLNNVLITEGSTWEIKMTNDRNQVQ
jgi:hypothetical protein